MRKTFKKEERLCNKSLLSKLFHSGSSFVVYPFRVVYMDIPLDRIKSPVNAVISVSKRRFKAAHDRNRIKRLMREVYRLQKADLLYPSVKLRSSGLLLAIQYVGKEEMPFAKMMDKMEKALKQLVDEGNQ
ncbi:MULTISPECIES: ribonuclease P protein component [Sphingobacterium]|uniref:ribonuclease P protein component n=1 Tax=Sphingobacterium TaxID=28453 RepID=UPI0013D9FA4B|nr:MULTISPECIES: ribonuclease P protein component [unclassified Sphingobacterium]